MPSIGAILGRVRRVTSWAIDSARRRGVMRTVTIAVNRRHAVSYQPTKARPFQDLLRRLDLPAGGTFVDVGSGKGRVLLLAARHPFKRVVGIEFSPSLCEQARRNIEIFRAQVPRSARRVLPSRLRLSRVHERPARLI